MGLRVGPKTGPIIVAQREADRRDEEIRLKKRELELREKELDMYEREKLNDAVGQRLDKCIDLLETLVEYQKTIF